MAIVTVLSLQTTQLCCKLRQDAIRQLFEILQTALTRNLTDEAHLRLLRVSCSSIRWDLFSVLPSFMAWLYDTCSTLAQTDDRRTIQMVVQTLMAATDALNRNFGCNMGPFLLDQCQPLISLALRQAGSLPVAHHETFARFFQSVLEVLDSYACKLTGLFVPCQAMFVVSAQPIVRRIAGAFLGLDFLKAATLAGRPSGSHGSTDGFVDVRIDPRVKIEYEVASRGLLQLLLDNTCQTNDTADERAPKRQRSGETIDSLNEIVTQLTEGLAGLPAGGATVATPGAYLTQTPTTKARHDSLKVETLLFLLSTVLENWSGKIVLIHLAAIYLICPRVCSSAHYL